MSLDEFMKKTMNFRCRPRAICADGFGLSIQASHYHCCRPRKSGLTDYTHYELGFPSSPMTELQDYAEGKKLTQTVYCYVPKEELEKVLKSHGDIQTWRN